MISTSTMRGSGTMVQFDQWNERLATMTFHFDCVTEEHQAKLKAQMSRIKIHTTFERTLCSRVTHVICGRVCDENEIKWIALPDRKHNVNHPRGSTSIHLKAQSIQKFKTFDPKIKVWPLAKFEKLITALESISRVPPQVHKPIFRAGVTNQINLKQQHFVPLPSANNVTVRTFKGHYVKIEDPHGYHRPVMLKDYDDVDKPQKSTWHVLDFTGNPGRCGVRDYCYREFTDELVYNEDNDIDENNQENNIAPAVDEDVRQKALMKNSSKTPTAQATKLAPFIKPQIDLHLKNTTSIDSPFRLPLPPNQNPKVATKQTRLMETPKHFTSALPKNTTPGNKHNDQKSLNNHSKQSSSKKSRKPIASKSGHCEVCEVSFEHYSEHMQSPLHIKKFKASFKGFNMKRRQLNVQNQVVESAMSTDSNNTSPDLKNIPRKKLLQPKQNKPSLSAAQQEQALSRKPGSSISLLVEKLTHDISHKVKTSNEIKKLETAYARGEISVKDFYMKSYMIAAENLLFMSRNFTDETKFCTGSTSKIPLHDEHLPDYRVRETLVLPTAQAMPGDQMEIDKIEESQLEKMDIENSSKENLGLFAQPPHIVSKPLDEPAEIEEDIHVTKQPSPNNNLELVGKNNIIPQQSSAPKHLSSLKENIESSVQNNLIPPLPIVKDAVQATTTAPQTDNLLVGNTFIPPQPTVEDIIHVTRQPSPNKNLELVAKNDFIPQQSSAPKPPSSFKGNESSVLNNLITPLPIIKQVVQDTIEPSPNENLDLVAKNDYIPQQSPANAQAVKLPVISTNLQPTLVEEPPKVCVNITSQSLPLETKEIIDPTSVHDRSKNDGLVDSQGKIEQVKQILVEVEDDDMLEPGEILEIGKLHGGVNVLRPDLHIGQGVKDVEMIDEDNQASTISSRGIHTQGNDGEDDIEMLEAGEIREVQTSAVIIDLKPPVTSHSTLSMVIDEATAKTSERALVIETNSVEKIVEKDNLLSSSSHLENIPTPSCQDAIDVLHEPRQKSIEKATEPILQDVLEERDVISSEKQGSSLSELMEKDNSSLFESQSSETELDQEDDLPLALRKERVVIAAPSIPERKNVEEPEDILQEPLDSATEKLSETVAYTLMNIRNGVDEPPLSRDANNFDREVVDKHGNVTNLKVDANGPSENVDVEILDEGVGEIDPSNSLSVIKDADDIIDVETLDDVAVEKPACISALESNITASSIVKNKSIIEENSQIPIGHVTINASSTLDSLEKIENHIYKKVLPAKIDLKNIIPAEKRRTSVGLRILDIDSSPIAPNKLSEVANVGSKRRKTRNPSAPKINQGPSSPSLSPSLLPQGVGMEESHPQATFEEPEILMNIRGSIVRLEGRYSGKKCSGDDDNPRNNKRPKLSDMPVEIDEQECIIPEFPISHTPAINSSSFEAATIETPTANTASKVANTCTKTPATTILSTKTPTTNTKELKKSTKKDITPKIQSAEIPNNAHLGSLVNTRATPSIAQTTLRRASTSSKVNTPVIPPKDSLKRKSIDPSTSNKNKSYSWGSATPPSIKPPIGRKSPLIPLSTKIKPRCRTPSYRSQDAVLWFEDDREKSPFTSDGSLTPVESPVNTPRSGRISKQAMKKLLKENTELDYEEEDEEAVDEEEK